MRDPRRAYRVVDRFEDELCVYTGAPFSIAVNSCTNALLLALTWDALHGLGRFRAVLPRRTYVGVLQSVLNAGLEVEWSDDRWLDQYTIEPYRVVDSARRIAPGMYRPGSLTCLSFHARKQLPLGYGGAILTDKLDAADWFSAARMDGRPPGAPVGQTVFPGFHCPLSPDVAARGLWILSDWNDKTYTPPRLPDETYPDLSQLLAAA